MKEHFQDYGVRRWAGDDLIELQGEPLEALQRLVEPYAPCIIQGCGINTAENRIEPGLVALWLLDGEKKRQCVKIARFGGCPTTNLPVYLTLKCSQETRVYADGDSKVVANSYTAQESILWEEVKDMYPLTITETGGTRLPENISVNFGPATERENIESGERLPILFGKIYRWLSSLKGLAFKNEVSKDDLDESLKKEIDGKSLKNHTHPADTSLDASSENPVQNKVVKAALDGKANSSHTHNYLPLDGGSMSGSGGIQYPTANGTTKTGNFISAGGGYGTGSGKNGLKLLSFDSSDGQAGMGNDLTGYTYETTLAAAQDTSGNTHITFAKHAANSKTYTRLAEIDGSGNFNAKGQVKENGTRVYSPNNKPTPGDIGAATSGHTHTPSSIGAAASSHTHDYLPLVGGTITGNLRLKGNGNFGNKLNFGDGEYVYLHEAADDKLTIYSKSGIDFAASSTSQPFNVKGQLQENGQRVYSPNNKPPQATTSADGLMSASDKSKLNGIAAGAQVNPAYATASINSTVPTNTDGYYQTGASNNGSYMNWVGTSNTVARGDHKHSLFIPDATTSKPGLMSKTDKSILDKLNEIKIVGFYIFNDTEVGIKAYSGFYINCRKATDPVNPCYSIDLPTTSGFRSDRQYSFIFVPGYKHQAEAFGTYHKGGSTGVKIIYRRIDDNVPEFSGFTLSMFIVETGIRA